MDIIQHGVHSVLISDLMYKLAVGSSSVIINPWLALLFFVIGILPDLSGWIDGKIRGEKYRWNGAYQFFHEGLIKKNVLLIIGLIITFPGLMLHIFIDKFWHKPDGGWIDNGVVYNLIGWVITLIMVYILFVNNLVTLYSN